MTRHPQAVPQRIVPDLMDETLYVGEINRKRLWRGVAFGAPLGLLLWAGFLWLVFGGRGG